MIETFIKGIIIGIIISAPLGPVGVLCLRETLNGGRREGLITGVGAMISDVFYSLIVYIGVGLVLDFIIEYEVALRILGGGIIVWFSYHLFRSAGRFKVTPTRKLSKMHGLRKVATAFLVTLANPFIMLLILPLYARLDFVRPSAYPQWQALLSMVSIALGCMLWWAVMTYWVRRLAYRGMRGVRIISYVIASALAIIGVLSLYTGTVAIVTGDMHPSELRQLNETYFSPHEDRIVEE